MEVPEFLVHANQVTMRDEDKRKNKTINYSSLSFAEDSFHLFCVFAMETEVTE